MSIQPDRGLLTAIMSAVHYFDIFQHPLQIDELQQLLHEKTCSREELKQGLSHLTETGVLQEKDGYYLPHNHVENIERRESGASRARTYWPVARKKSVLISRFPFVRAVLISGSLSKNYMDTESDIDYLVITRPGRLWVSRTLLVLYKKLFLFNSHKYFCVNYFIDSDHLELSDKNLFTATELLFATPTFNSALYQTMLEKNSWVRNYYPSFSHEPAHMNTVTSAPGRFQKILELAFAGKAGDIADSLCMNLFKFYWKIKFRWMEKERFNRDMKSVKGVSKHHPNNFRNRILNEHRKRMVRYEMLQADIILSETGAVSS